MSAEKKFTLTEEHLTLLREAYVSWDDTEFGAPQIDPKRPYGNSDVLLDIAEALGLDERADEDGELPEELAKRLSLLHEETQTALQIVLRHAGQAVEPGDYEADAYMANWRRA